MGSGRACIVALTSILLACLLAWTSYAAACDDPHCISLEDIPLTRPSQSVRESMITGNAVVDVSSRVIEEIDRGGKPAARRFKMRRYPVDIGTTTNVSLGFGDVIEFTLNRVKFRMEATDYSGDNLQLKIFPAKEFTNLTPQETKTYDVNHDGTPDFSLTMGAPEANQVQVMISPGANPPPSRPSNEVTTMIDSSLSPTNPVPAQPAPTPMMGPQTVETSLPDMPSAAPYQPPPAQTPPESGIPPAPQYQSPPATYQAEPAQYIGEPAPAAADYQYAAATPSSEQKTGMGIFGWGIIAALFTVAMLAATSVFMVKREHEHVNTVSGYLLKSLSQKVPLPQAVEALSKEGWSKSVTDKALAAIAGKYREDTLSKGGDANVIKNQLMNAGMPEDVLNQVFK